MQNRQHPIYGTTVHIGQTELTTIYGNMTAYIFQDLIHKGYIVALAHGDLKAPVLYTRLHSSCVTSELMRSLDCDCVQQLNGAIQKVCEGNGIFFYLIQEGRGCGYVGKSRGCMTVQYYEEVKNINTFQAYEMLGMKHDYRQYTNVKDILTILDIKSKFILLTNNPDKIEKFTKLGIEIEKVESIEIPPNPFNQTYLMSKQQYGHILYEAKNKVQKYVLPYERIAPFTPYSIPGCTRFIRVSSYYLPLQPSFNQILLTEEEYRKYCHNAGNSYQIVKDPANHNKRAYYTKLSLEEISKNADNLSRPNWFQINVHYDVVTHQDYLILKYGSPENNEVPIVRIQSENIFNRFPLVDRAYADRYERSLDYIIRNGYGLVLIFYNDGRGAGLGNYVMNLENESRPSKEKDCIGVEEDKRDYYGAINLLKHYLDPTKPIDLLCGNTSFKTYEKLIAGEKTGIKVRKYIKLEDTSEERGVDSVQKRIISLKNDLEHLEQSIRMPKVDEFLNRISQAVKQGRRVYSTGIGTSEAHSKCLANFFEGTIQHVNPMNTSIISGTNNILIMFSQGLSPNAICCLNNIDLKNVVLITAVDPDLPQTNSKKQEFIEKVKENNALVLVYPKEQPDNTLIRVTGPFLVFYLIALLKRLYFSSPKERENKRKELLEATCSLLSPSFQKTSKLNSLVESVAPLNNLVICCDYPAIEVALNLRLKFMEGAMINTHMVDYANFAHGIFQFINNTNEDYCIWFITQSDKKLHSKTIEMLNCDERKIHTTFYDRQSYDTLPLTLEVQANHVVFQLIQLMGVNQAEWPGKSRQNILYEVYS